MLEFIVPFTDKAAAEKFDRCHGTNGELVRCGDCKWFDCKNWVCNGDILVGRIADHGCYPNFNVEPDWFCADGERREAMK